MFFTISDGIPSPITFLINVSSAHSGIFQSNGSVLTINNSYIESTRGSEYNVAPLVLLKGRPG